jgi:hypothetical protein
VSPTAPATAPLRKPVEQFWILSIILSLRCTAADIATTVSLPVHSLSSATMGRGSKSGVSGFEELNREKQKDRAFSETPHILGASAPGGIVGAVVAPDERCKPGELSMCGVSPSRLVLTVAGAFSKLLDFCRPAFARRVTIQCPDFAKGLRKKGSRTLSDGRPSLRWLPILLKPCTRSGH